ncbi:MAG: glycosyltransferase family 2 protein [bacterium]|nr:glycosyltransferase family 2 protein [bacterium]
MKIAFLLPAYNEEKNISNVIQNLPAHKKDIIVIDDGSKDNTSSIVEKTGVVLIKHKQNMGKGAAHQNGFNYAIKHGYDYIITLDSDGQHKPQESKRFIRQLEKNNRPDIIIGTRAYSLKNMPVLRFFTNFTTSFIVSLLAHNRIKDSQSGYRAISTEVLKKVKLTTFNYQTESEILINLGRMGYKIGAVPITIIYGVSESKINPIIDAWRFIQLTFKSIWR